MAGARAWAGTVIVLLLLAGVGLLPVFGVAHGRIQPVNVYSLYLSGTLR